MSVTDIQIEWEVALFELSNVASTAVTGFLAWRFYKGSSTRNFSDSFLACLTAACSIRCMWCAVWDQTAAGRTVVLLDAFLNALLASSALGLLVRNHADAAEGSSSSSTPTFAASLKPWSLRSESLILVCLILAYLLNPGENAEEYFPQTMVAWACYLDAAALAPQLWLLLLRSKDGAAGDKTMSLDEDSPTLPAFAAGLLVAKLLRAGFWAHMFQINNMRCFYCLFTADFVALAFSFAIFGLGFLRPWLQRTRRGEDRGLLLDIGGSLELQRKAATASFEV